MFAVALILCLVVTLTVQNAVGPVGKLAINNIDDCANFKSKVKLQLTKDSKNRKVVNGEVDINEDFTADWTFEIIADKWTGSEYKKKSITTTGKICEYANKQAPELRKKIYADAKVSGDCGFKKGKYTFSTHAVEKNLKISALPYGKFKLHIKFFNPKKEEIGCSVADIEHSEK